MASWPCHFLSSFPIPVMTSGKGIDGTLPRRYPPGCQPSSEHAHNLTGTQPICWCSSVKPSTNICLAVLPFAFWTMLEHSFQSSLFRILLWVAFVPSDAWIAAPLLHFRTPLFSTVLPRRRFSTFSSTSSSSSTDDRTLLYDYTVPDDAVVHIKPLAMKRLRELRDQQVDRSLTLRMGVRSGGCSGMSYVMDFSTQDAIQDDDAVDSYGEENIMCVVDAKSMLYLYGLELDYSEALIGGGFKFYNPNAGESCGCGSSFGV